MDVLICDVGPRDGLQNEPEALPHATRATLVTRLAAAGVPRIEAVSTVGSGDAFLAGFLSAHQAGQAADQCLKIGLACGAANTQTVGAGVFESREVPRFAAMVEVQEIAPTAARAS